MIISFLTDRQQLVRLGKLTSRTLTISTGAPQGCVLSPLLFSLYTNECTSKDNSVKLLKFADDTTVIGLIKDGDESAYRQEVEQLAVWCSLINLPQELLKQLYSAIIETVLCSSITVWFGSATKTDIRRLQRTVRTAERMISAPLPNLQDLYISRMRKRAKKVTLDPSHTAHSLFEP